MKKILLVEDEIRMRKLYQLAFSLEGIEIDVAEDGEIGLQKAYDQSPDLILLDIMMPKMNGMDVLQKLKSDEKTKNIPIVMLTNIASGTLEAAQEAVKMGATKYIIKSDHEPKEVVQIAIEVISNSKE